MKPWPALAPFAQTLSFSGGELFYYDSDPSNTSNKPTILLIHGLGDEADTWRHIFPVLCNAGYRVIAPDLPGFGRSLWKGRISIRGHRNAVMRLMAVAGAASRENPAALAGSSLGAGIAEMVAAKRPHLVHTLILLDGCFPFAYKIDRAMFLLTLPFVGKGWYRGFRSDHEGAWKSLYPYYANLDGMSDADKEFLRERVIDRVTSPNQEHGYFATLRSMNALFLLGQRSMARMIQSYAGAIALIWGEHDHVFLQRRVKPFRDLRPDAPFTLIPGAGHLPHQEKPDETAAQMLRFLNEKG